MKPLITATGFALTVLGGLLAEVNWLAISMQPPGSDLLTYDESISGGLLCLFLGIGLMFWSIRAID